MEPINSMICEGAHIAARSSALDVEEASVAGKEAEAEGRKLAGGEQDGAWRDKQAAEPSTSAYEGPRDGGDNSGEI